MFDSFEEVKTAFEAAQTKWHQGNLLAAYNDLLKIFTERLFSGHLMDADLKVIQSLADLAGLFGEFQAVDQLLQGAIALYETANSPSNADYTRLRRIQLELDKGNIYRARDCLQLMAPRIGDINCIQFSPFGLVQWEEGCVWPGTEPQERVILFAELYLAMGRLLSALGQYGEALQALKRGLSHTEGEEVPSLARQTVIPLKLAIAASHLEKGDLGEADTYLSHLQNQLEYPQHPEYSIRWLELSGKLNLLRGELGKGLEQFRQVQATCRQLGSQRAVLRSTLNLAYVLILLNQTSTAQNYLVDAQVDASAIQDAALTSRVELLLSLAHARSRSVVVGSPITVSGMRRKKNDNLVVTGERAKLDLRKSPNYLTLFEDRCLAFQWQLSDFNLGTAGALLKQIKAAFQFTDSRLIQVQIQVLEGIFAYYQGLEREDPNRVQVVSNLSEIRQANKILDEVRLQLEEMGLKPELWQVQRILGWCRTRLNYPTPELEALTESTNNLLAQLTESLSPEDQVIYLLNKWTDDEEYIAARINQLQRLQLKLVRSPFWLRPWWRLTLMGRLNDLVEHIDQYKDVLVKRTIKKQNVEVKDVPASSLWRRLVTHPKKRVTLSFLVLPDRVFVVRAWKFFFDFAVIPTTRLEVRNTVQRWHEKIKGINGSRDLSAIPDEDSYESVMAAVANKSKDVANNLAKILEIPSLLEGIPKNTQALTIVPDDILHGFPFATVVHQGKYLVEHYALSIAYESRNSKSPTSPSDKAEKALVVGVSQGVSQGTRQFSPLPEVRREINQVAQWLTAYQIDLCTLMDNAANKASVIDGLSEATLLHIACHGTFEQNRPDQSGLVLISNSEQKEILSLRELSNLDLKRLRHATLSSCWSADHFILPGRWIISLPETLWRSGTQSILGCLWEVYDKVAASFMKRFYEYLDKVPRDEALCMTQRECLHGCLPDYGNIDYLIKKNIANPIFWAGFSLYGDYRTLDLAPASQQPRLRLSLPRIFYNK
ncbi:MAG: CHAT domain-containing protein [Pleurocapsa sp. MO_192.B19]|nr:CHAT domain-containing protein [Pleurocapsa sp. MO_192.B19]